MKKFLAIALSLVMVLGLFAVHGVQAEGMDDLIAAAQAEGELIVYGSCEEDYLAAACEHFEELYGIKVKACWSPMRRRMPPTCWATPTKTPTASGMASTRASWASSSTSTS